MEADKPIAEMSAEEYARWMAEQMMGGWVPIDRYMRMFPNEKRKNIETRLQRGIWKRGVHYSVPQRGSRAWVNLIAIRKWIEDDARQQDGGYEDNHSPKPPRYPR